MQSNSLFYFETICTFDNLVLDNANHSSPYRHLLLTDRRNVGPRIGIPVNARNARHSLKIQIHRTWDFALQ